MTDPQVPLSELRAYQLRRQLVEVGSGLGLLSGIDPDASVFIRDFKAISHSLNDQLEGWSPKPHGIPMFPPFRKAVMRQSLPFGPLRRMARRVGIDELRYLFEVGSDNAMDPYRLIIRPRFDKEFSRGNRYKRHDQRADKIEFGNRVLELERDKSGCEKFGRTEALQLAGAECGLKAASSRSFERYFSDFRTICTELGYVPHPLEAFGHAPMFALADLDGRASDKAQK